MCSTPLPQVRAGIGFTNDDRLFATFLALRREVGIRVYGVTSPGKPVRVVPVGVAEEPEGPPFTFGTLAVSASQDDKESPEHPWRFAWQTPRGVRVEPRQSLISSDGRPAGRVYYLYGSTSPPRQPLLAWKLNFSDSGNLLVMQSFEISKRQWTIMVWDLRKEWAEHVKAIELDPIRGTTRG
jgi:hypothetical protein